ncbi:MAG TPA: hypothetical protein VG477_07020 [Thermoanaerobaculia bacterium]|nr:hypothetical protein [Thermoanaerobaculia bacterium]
MRKMMFKISKFAPAALLAAGLLTAGEAQARGCDDANPLMMCPLAECIALQNQVNLLCKTPAPLACRNVSGCAARTAMRQRWVDCRDARVTINNTCWSGGDPGHIQAVTQANISITKCDTEIAKPTTQGGCADPCPKK